MLEGVTQGLWRWKGAGGFSGSEIHNFGISYGNKILTLPIVVVIQKNTIPKIIFMKRIFKTLTLCCVKVWFR